MSMRIRSSYLNDSDVHSVDVDQLGVAIADKILASKQAVPVHIKEVEVQRALLLEIGKLQVAWCCTVNFFKGSQSP